jgi:hypothetical protein
MILKKKHSQRVVSALAALIFLGAATPVLGEEASLLKEQTEDFFSDQSRVGSIVGGILAGAAFANPFAPLGGTIIGFIVGKGTDFSKEAEAESSYYARRSFAPAAESGHGGVTETLALSVSGPELDASAPEGTGEVAELAMSVAGGSDDELVTDESDAAQENPDAEPVLAETDKSESEPETPRPPAVNLIISKDVGGKQAELDRLAAIIRGERNGTPFQLNQQCPNQEASRIRKKVVVAGFNVENPDQAVFGGLGSVGYAASEWLYQNLLDTGEVLPLSAPTRQMFASLRAGPTRETAGNRLEQYSAVSRQMGAQFVVSGIIRNLNVNRAESWDSSYASSIKRSLFSADTVREFVVDVVLHDGYTGQVVSEQRYSASGRWDIPRTGKVSFGSPVFNESEYGVAVAEVFDGITDDLMSTIDCQALLVPILEVSGKDLLLDVGTRSGLLPGDKLRVVRAESSLQRPNAPPKLWDTGVDLHLHQLSLDTSRAWMPEEGGIINVREGDYAVMY